jgi:hypothetical protein
MMAAVAKYRDDVAGTITTGGTSTAYMVASNQVFGSLATMSGRTVAFVPQSERDGQSEWRQKVGYQYCWRGRREFQCAN